MPAEAEAESELEVEVEVESELPRRWPTRSLEAEVAAPGRRMPTGIADSAWELAARASCFRKLRP